MVIEIVDNGSEATVAEVERRVVEAAVEWYELGGLLTSHAQLRDLVGELVTARAKPSPPAAQWAVTVERADGTTLRFDHCPTWSELPQGENLSVIVRHVAGIV
jgi:hypothetical protein